MSGLTCLFLLAAAYIVLGHEDIKDSKVAASGVSLSQALIGVGGLGGYSLGTAIDGLGISGIGSGAALNNAGAVGASQLSAIQNAQAAQAARIANSAAVAIQGARNTEAAARAGQLNAINNAQALDAARIGHVQRAQAAAWENARSAENARRAALASAAELARAAEAGRLANAARIQAVAIANTRAVEAARIANAARAQAAAVATSAAQTHAIADAVARTAHESGLLLGDGGLVGSVVAGPAVAVGVSPVAVGGWGHHGYSNKVVH